MRITARVETLAYDVVVLALPFRQSRPLALEMPGHALGTDRSVLKTINKYASINDLLEVTVDCTEEIHPVAFEGGVNTIEAIKGPHDRAGEVERIHVLFDRNRHPAAI